MRAGLSAVKNYENQGMPAAHCDAFMQVARERNEVIMVRPVELICRTLLEEGYATKNFHIKGKSSNWGPQAGFVCVNQKFSKKHGDDEAVRKYNAEVEGCIAKHYAIAQQLEISRERLQELQDLEILASLVATTSGGYMMTALPPNGSPMYTFVATHNLNTGKFAISVRESSADVPLTVLAYDKGIGAMTADYDLLAVCPAMSDVDFGTRDRMKVVNVSHVVVERRIEGYRRGRIARFDPFGPTQSVGNLAKMLGMGHTELRESAKPENFYALEDQDKGNITPRINACALRLNAVIGRGAGYETVHHNADTGSPATDMSANFPAPSFHPRDFGPTVKDACLIENRHELALYFKGVLDSEYWVPRNPLWDAELRGVRSTRFTEARIALARKLGG